MNRQKMSKNTSYQSSKFIKISQPKQQYLHETISQFFTAQQVQKKAQQSLLSMQNENSMYDVKNPQTEFLKLTKNIKINSFNHMNQKNLQQQKFINRNTFRKTKSSFNRLKQSSQKDLVSIWALSNNSSHGQDSTKLSLNSQLQNLFVRTKSNLLSPRQSLPTIYGFDKNYSVLTKKTRNMKPYSNSKKTHIQLIQIIKLKGQIPGLPTLDNNKPKRKLQSYD